MFWHLLSLFSISCACLAGDGLPCDFIAKTKAGLSNHKRFVHNAHSFPWSKYVISNECIFCGMVGSCKSVVREHLKSKASNLGFCPLKCGNPLAGLTAAKKVSKQLRCLECKAEFSSDSELRDHHLRH